MKHLLCILFLFSPLLAQTDSLNYFPFNPHQSKPKITDQMKIALQFDSVSSLSITKKSFFLYETMKKDKGVAFAYYTLVPGGGAFYAENGSALLYLILGYSEAYWLFTTKKDVEFPLVIFIVTRLFELQDTFESVDNYNKELMSRLKIHLAANSRGVGFGLELSL